MGRLDGKVALVTGGASGIGKAAVERFVAEGARVIVGDTDSEGIGALIGQLGHNYLDGAEVDVRDEAAVERMVNQAIRRFGRLDIAVNNAGVGGFSPIQDYPLEDWDRVLGISLTGTFLCLKHEAKRLIWNSDGTRSVSMLSGPVSSTPRRPPGCSGFRGWRTHSSTKRRSAVPESRRTSRTCSPTSHQMSRRS